MATGVEAAYGYDLPNLLIDHAMRNPHITAGFWRGVNVNQNAVYMECFMDELAEAAAGQDPLAYRLKYLKPKWAAVLKAACDKAGYGKPLPEGRFHGISQVMGYGSYVAGVAEVSVSKPTGSSRSTRSRRRPIPATWSIRRRSTARSRARSSMACPPRCTARSPSRTARSSRPTSTPTT